MQNHSQEWQGVAVPLATPPARPSQARSKGVALVIATLALCSLMSANAPDAEARYTWLGNKVGQTFHYNTTGQWRPYHPPYRPPTYHIQRSRPMAPVQQRVPRYSGGTRFIF